MRKGRSSPAIPVPGWSVTLRNRPVRFYRRAWLAELLTLSATEISSSHCRRPRTGAGLRRSSINTRRLPLSTNPANGCRWTRRGAAFRSGSPNSSPDRSGSDLRVRLGELHGVFPAGFAGDDVGVKVKKDGLAGAIVRLLLDWEIKLPPVRQRQVGRIPERNAFAEAGLEPAEETIEAAGGGDAKRRESLTRVRGVLLKIDVVNERRLAKREKGLAGGLHHSVRLKESFAEWVEIEIVVAWREAASAECIGRKRHQKSVRGLRNDARARLEESFAGIGDEVNDVFGVEAESAECFADQDVAALRQAHALGVLAN